MAQAKYPHSGLPGWDGQPFAIDDPRIPLAIRQSVADLAATDDMLYFADTDASGEWWLIDTNGELRECFWLEK